MLWCRSPGLLPPAAKQTHCFLYEYKGRLYCSNCSQAVATLGTLEETYAKKAGLRKKEQRLPGAMHRAFFILHLTCLILWSRFPLCWAFLFSRLILFWLCCFFWHKINFSLVNYLLMAATSLAPFSPIVFFRSGNCTAGLKDMSIRVKTLFNIGGRLPPGAVLLLCCHPLLNNLMLSFPAI